MMETVIANKSEVNAAKEPKGPKYFINIEGNKHEWPRETITTEEIAHLGGWANEGVIEIDEHNEERTLSAGEVIQLKPGMGFAKKIRWQRGDGVFDLRLYNEFQHLKGHFKTALQHENWFLLPDHPLPEGWSLKTANIAFRVLPGYPATPPYGFFVPNGLRFEGAIPSNYQEGVADVPPFDGKWAMFSWAPQEWKSSDSIAAGFNLLNFALSFTVRLKEGA
jgi:hypothetical protein